MPVSIQLDSSFSEENMSGACVCTNVLPQTRVIWVVARCLFTCKKGALKCLWYSGPSIKVDENCFHVYHAKVIIGKWI